MRQVTNKEMFFRVFPKEVREALMAAVPDFHKLQEIRLRAGLPIYYTYNNVELVLEQAADRKQTMDPVRLVEDASTHNPWPAWLATGTMLKEILTCLSNYSVYAVEQDLRQGFLTMPGGHRVGICGKLVWENGLPRSLREISSMNFRVAHSYPGCAETIVRQLGLRKMPGNVLLVSPPGCGKTTMLRDLIRLLSEGGRTVGVVDERSEIAASYQGARGCYLGPRTDVLDATPKVLGMQMLLRSMAPDYIAVDEIGSDADVHELRNAMHSGCHLIVTCHGSDKVEIRQKRSLGGMISEGCFQGIVYLSKRNGVGTIEEVERIGC